MRRTQPAAKATVPVQDQTVGGVLIVVIMLQTTGAILLTLELEFLAEHFIAYLLHLAHKLRGIGNRHHEVLLEGSIISRKLFMGFTRSSCRALTIYPKQRIRGSRFMLPLASRASTLCNKKVTK